MDYSIIDESCQINANNQIVGVVRLCMVAKQLELAIKNNCSLTNAKWSLACHRLDVIKMGYEKMG